MILSARERNRRGGMLVTGAGSWILATVQFRPQALAPATNLARVAVYVAEAQARGARLVVLPELFNTGYLEHAGVHDLAEAADGTTVRALHELSRKYSIYLAGGFAERYHGHVYDSLAFCTPRGEVAIYRKRHLIFWEHYYFRPGREPLIVETELGRIGFAICADMMYQHVWSEYRGKIDLAVISAAWPCSCEGSTRRVAWLLRPSRHLAGEIPLRVARDLNIAVAFANQCGPCQVRVPMLGLSVAQFVGRSAVYDGHAAKGSEEVAGEGIIFSSVSVREGIAACAILSA